jgi:hypothetical protein
MQLGGFMKIVRFGGLKVSEPEYKSVAALAEHLIDNDLQEYSCFQLQVLASNLRTPVHVVKAKLAEYGLSLKHREFEKQIRGFTSNPNAGRFEGMHGGGGGSSIMGLAGNPERTN